MNDIRRRKPGAGRKPNPEPSVRVSVPASLKPAVQELVARSTAQPESRGGKRAGSGRPNLYDGRSVPMRVPAHMKQVIQANMEGIQILYDGERTVDLGEQSVEGAWFAISRVLSHRGMPMNLDACLKRMGLVRIPQ